MLSDPIGAGEAEFNDRLNLTRLVNINLLNLSIIHLIFQKLRLQSVFEIVFLEIGRIVKERTMLGSTKQNKLIIFLNGQVPRLEA